MPKTVTNGLLYARQWCLDTDTSNPVNSDTEILRDANAAYAYIRDVLSPRYVWETATTLGSTMTAGDFVTTVTLKTIAEIRAVFFEASTSTTAGRPLQPASLEGVRRRAFTGSSPGPREYALQRLGTFTAADIGQWKIHIWPGASGGTPGLSAIVRYEITDLSAGTDKADLSDTEDNMMWETAAACAAVRMNKLDRANLIFARLPEKMQARFNVAAVSVKPREVGEKVA